VYVKSALAGSDFFSQTYNGFSNRRLRQNRLKSRVICQHRPTNSGAHSREDSGNHERADGAHCASLRFSSVSQHLLRSDERQAQPESVMAPAGPPES
jgi:hypothetical protein